MERGWRTNTVSMPTTRPTLVTHWTLRHINSSTALWFGEQKKGTAERHTVIHLTYTYEQVSGEESMKGVWCRHANGTRHTVVTSVSIDRCMQELDSGLPPAPTPFPGNLWPLWLVRTTAHTQKAKDQPERQVAAWDETVVKPYCPFKPHSEWESKTKPKLKERAWLVLAEQRWRQVTYGGPATLRTGTIQDPNWKVNRVQGFEPESSAQTETMNGYISTAFKWLLVLRSMAVQ